MLKLIKAHTRLTMWGRESKGKNGHIASLRSVLFLGFVIVLGGFPYLQAQSPIQLHPDNSRYLQYKGEPILLITSAEHYGGVLNLDFDYETYLNTLHREGMNYTRLFTGSYVEVPGSFGIGNNTLAPAVDRFITPWLRTEEEGVFQGEKKVDLDSWNPAYFDRFHSFMKLAESLEIIVEVTFFSSNYQDMNWERNPFNDANNINGLPKSLDRKKANTPDNGKLLAYQKKMVAKIVQELNPYPNLIYELQNEPWSDNGEKVYRLVRTIDPGQKGWYKWADAANVASMAWQKTIAQTIVDTEAALPNKHLIAQNYTNFAYAIPEVDPNISILNFHYAWPDAVWKNYGWNLPINFDESGFYGDSDTTYLRQAWQFMLAGGAIFNNLDYSFFVGAEKGNGKNEAPGGGSTTFRKQLTYLQGFLSSMDFIWMQPDHTVVYHAPGLDVQALSEEGKQYALALHGHSMGWVKLQLPEGEYSWTATSPFTGEEVGQGSFQLSTEGIHKLDLPAFSEMMGLKVLAK